MIAKGRGDHAQRVATHNIFACEQVGRTLVVTPALGFHSLSDEAFSVEVYRLADAIHPDTNAIVVDLGQAGACSSDRLLGPLVMLWNRVRSKQGRLTVCGLCSHGREVLRRTKLDTVWTLSDTRAAALAE